MTIVDEIRQLRRELAAHEARAAEIRTLLVAAQAAFETELSPLEAIALPAPTLADRVLALLAASPRQTGELADATESRLEATRRVLRALEADSLVYTMGRGPALRWHIADAGKARIEPASPPPAAPVVPTSTVDGAAPSGERHCGGPGDDPATDPCPRRAVVSSGLADSRRCDACIREWRRRRAQARPTAALAGPWNGRDSLTGDRDGYRSALADAR